MNVAPRMLLLSACLLPALAAPVSALWAVQDAATDERAAVLARLAELELTISIDRELEQAHDVLDELFGEGGTAAELSSDAEIAAARARLESLLSDASGSGRSDLRETIREALHTGNVQAIQDLGEPGFAELERMVREAPGDLSKPAPQGQPGDRVQKGLDPLFVLTAERPRAALELVLDMEHSGRPIHSRRVLDAALGYCTQQSEAWEFFPGSRPRLGEPRWLPIVTRLAADALESNVQVDTNILAGSPEQNVWRPWNRRTPDKALGALARTLYDFEGYTPEVIAALLDAASSGDSDVGRLIVEPMADNRLGLLPAVQPLLEGLVATPDTTARRIVARRLADFEVGSALLSMAEDPDWRVRQAVASGLGRREIKVLSWDGDGRVRSEHMWRMPTLDGAAVDVLARLLRDTESAVRHDAMQSLVSHPDKLLTDDQYRALAASEDVTIREVLVDLQLPDQALRMEILTQLAADRDPRVIKALDLLLEQAAEQDRLALMLPVLRERTSNTSFPLWARSPWLGDRFARDSALNEPDVIVALAGWGLDAQQEPLLEPVFDALTRQEVLPKLWDTLSPGEMSELIQLWVAWLPSARTGPQITGQMHGWRDSLTSASVEAMAPLIADESVSIPARLLAVSACAMLAFDEHRAAIVDFLASPQVTSWMSDPANDPWYPEAIVDHRTSPRDRFALLEDLLRRDLPEPVMVRWLRAAATKAPWTGPESYAVSLVVLERWFPHPNFEGNEFVHSSLASLANKPELLPDGFWIEASTNSRFAHVATLAMANARGDDFIPALARRVLELGTNRDWGMVDDYIKPAIAGITSRLNDAAAEALLDIAARTASSPVRIVCMDGVATIQQYQEARAAWERRASSRATRDSAVLRLVGMLRAEQAEVRREAVRGLRVLGAVERIPDLIERLGDEDEGVREAARAALDRLAEPPAAEAPATGAAEDADTSDAEELPDG